MQLRPWCFFEFRKKGDFENNQRVTKNKELMNEGPKVRANNIKRTNRVTEGQRNDVEAYLITLINKTYYFCVRPVHISS